MALPPATLERQLKHRRSIDVQVFARNDGLWEVDARLIDTKTRDIPMAGGPRRAGEHAGAAVDTRNASGSEAPFQIGRCHALRADGPVVRQYYPRWYRAGTPDNFA